MANNKCQYGDYTKKKDMDKKKSVLSFVGNESPLYFSLLP